MMMKSLNNYLSSRIELSYIPFIICLCSPVSVIADIKDIFPEYLTVSVNHEPVPGFITTLHDGDNFWISLDDAKKLHIDVSGFEHKDGYVRFCDGEHLKLQYDPLNQSLLLLVTKDELAGETKINSNMQKFLKNDELSESVKGLLLSYSLYGQHYSGYDSLSSLSEFRSTGGDNGLFRSSFNTRLIRTEYTSSAEIERLDTNWTYSNPDKLISLIIGDNSTDTLSWGRSVRLAGLTITRDYSLQPSVNPGSRSVFMDSVTLPSTVDLYINGIKNSTQKISPGQFSLTTIPTFTGGGMAQVIITDINGRTRNLSLDLYGSQDTLGAGYHTESLSLGWLRENYSNDSFDYNTNPVINALQRYGLSNSLTLETQAEITNDVLIQGGAGLSWLTSPVTGIVNINVGRSQYNGDAGQQSGIGWQWHRNNIGISVNKQQYSRNFCDLGCLAGSQQKKKDSNIWLTVGTENIGNFGIGIVEQEYKSVGRSSYGSLSWSKSFGNGISFSLSGSRLSNGLQHNLVFYSQVSIALGNKYRASIQANRLNQKTTTQWQVQSLIDHSQPGWGWQIAGQQGGQNHFHAEMTKVSMTNELLAGTDFMGNDQSVYASMDGTIGFLDDGFYAMRNVPDAFAIVDTNGVSNIPVLLHNNFAGRTDQKGHFLLTDLNGWIPNEISIDPLSLPGDYRVPVTVATVIPRAGSGVRVHYNVYRARSILLRLRDKSGNDINVGSSVTVVTKEGIPSPEKNIVGYNGEVYLENPPNKGHLDVIYQSGRCVANLPDVKGITSSIERGEAICH
ncbi:fimbria/pilus outer membrane usher protein [Enterobacter hormaechei]